jgi:hypothetical protein
MNLPCTFGIQFTKNSNDFTKLCTFSIICSSNKSSAYSLEMTRSTQLCNVKCRFISNKLQDI